MNKIGNFRTQEKGFRKIMKILVYGINYSPVLTGTGKYTAGMCEWLAARGHSVDVITSMPFYPQWQIFSEYKGKWQFKEMSSGVIFYERIGGLIYESGMAMSS